MAKSLTITLSNRSIGSVSISNRAIGSVTLVDVVGESGFDADAQTFFNAGTFNDPLKTAYNTFFLNLKTGLSNGTNVFADQIALWILTSGNAADNAINAKNPGTFDLTFVNSPTHASTGVTFNGSSQYARTGVIPSTHLTEDDVSLAHYLTDALGSNGISMGSIGTGGNSVSALEVLPRFSNVLYFDSYSATTGRVSKANTDASGLITLTRRASNDVEIYKGATSFLSSTQNSGGTPPSFEIYIGAANAQDTTVVLPYANEFRIAMIGNGLTDNQVADWSAAVTQLFTDLGI